MTTTTEKRHELPEGWEWLDDCPWPERIRSASFVCGARWTDRSFRWWVSLDSEGFVVTWSKDGRQWGHEAVPLDVIDALRARANV